MTTIPGAGPHRITYAGGIRFDYLPAAIKTQVDAVIADDLTTLRDDEVGMRFIRPAAEVEKALLRHCGFSVSNSTETHVSATFSRIPGLPPRGVQRIWPEISFKARYFGWRPPSSAQVIITDASGHRPYL